MTTRIVRRLCAGPCGKNRPLSSYVSDKGRICAVCRKKTGRASARATHLSKTYNITTDEYVEIVDEQGGVCAICKGSRPYNLAVDHDHAIAELLGVRASIRGALCKRCNKALRDVRDDVELLAALIAYLKDPPARRVLGTSQLVAREAE